MYWYIVKIVFNIDIDNGRHSSQFDEQMRTIYAGSEEEAFMKATELGLQQEECFHNNRKNEVNWKFIGISELHSLEELRDGKEIHSSIHEVKEPGEYIREIKNKTQRIQEKCAVFV